MRPKKSLQEMRMPVQKKTVSGENRELNGRFARPNGGMGLRRGSQRDLRVTERYGDAGVGLTGGLIPDQSVW